MERSEIAYIFELRIFDQTGDKIAISIPFFSCFSVHYCGSVLLLSFDSGNMAEASPSMSQLRALLDDGEQPQSRKFSSRVCFDLHENKTTIKYYKLTAAEVKINEHGPLRQSKLGKALDGMMAAYAEIIALAHQSTPVPPGPTPEHVKETSEVHVKQWSDSCRDMTAELTRIALQWEYTYPEQKYQEVPRVLLLIVKILGIGRY